MAELRAAGGDCVGFSTIAGMKPKKQNRTGWQQAKASKACFRQSASARQAPAPSASFPSKPINLSQGRSMFLGRGFCNQTMIMSKNHEDRVNTRKSANISHDAVSGVVPHTQVPSYFLH